MIYHILFAGFPSFYCIFQFCPLMLQHHGSQVARPQDKGGSSDLL